jgi:hypothetical protein
MTRPTHEYRPPPYPLVRFEVIICGATMLMNSREVITLVFFQNFGKCLTFPVTK